MGRSISSATSVGERVCGVYRTTDQSPSDLKRVCQSGFLAHAMMEIESYAHLSQSYIAETIRANFPDLRTSRTARDHRASKGAFSFEIGNIR